MSRPLLDAAGLVDAVVEGVVSRLLADGGNTLADRIAKRLVEADRSGYLDLKGLAEKFSCSPEAMEKRVQRDPDLAQLALRIGRRRVWRAADVDAVLAQRRDERMGG